MAKISSKYSNLLTASLMGLSPSLIKSFTMTVVFMGFTPMFLNAGLQGFLVGTVVSSPASLILGPLVARIVTSLIAD